MRRTTVERKKTKNGLLKVASKPAIKLQVRRSR